MSPKELKKTVKEFTQASVKSIQTSYRDTHQLGIPAHKIERIFKKKYKEQVFKDRQDHMSADVQHINYLFNMLTEALKDTCRTLENETGLGYDNIENLKLN